MTRPIPLSMLLSLMLSSCASTRGDDTLPFVQPSASAAPDRVVRITPEATFGPGCIEIRPGQTVEWTSEAPDIPVNVTSLAPTSELFSPNLQPGMSCNEADRSQICWRHTFALPGCFDYFDTNSGSPGRAVRDAYYGTIKYVGEGSDVTRGTVCVSDSGRCPEVCCDTKFDCPMAAGDDYECVGRRCLKSEGGEPSPCTLK